MVSRQLHAYPVERGLDPDRPDLAEQFAPVPSARTWLQVREADIWATSGNWDCMLEVSQGASLVVNLRFGRHGPSSAAQRRSGWYFRVMGRVRGGYHRSSRGASGPS